MHMSMHYCGCHTVQRKIHPVMMQFPLWTRRTANLLNRGLYPLPVGYVDVSTTRQKGKAKQTSQLHTCKKIDNSSCLTYILYREKEGERRVMTSVGCVLSRHTAILCLLKLPLRSILYISKSKSHC